MVSCLAKECWLYSPLIDKSFGSKDGLTIIKSDLSFIWSEYQLSQLQIMFAVYRIYYKVYKTIKNDKIDLYFYYFEFKKRN